MPHALVNITTTKLLNAVYNTETTDQNVLKDLVDAILHPQVTAFKSNFKCPTTVLADDDQDTHTYQTEGAPHQAHYRRRPGNPRMKLRCPQ